MVRSYGEKFLLGLAATPDDENLGIQLAKACVEANIPATLVANVMGVSRITVYHWFRGQPMKTAKNRKAVEDFLVLMKFAVENGLLPAKDYAAAQGFVKEAIGIVV